MEPRKVEFTQTTIIDDIDNIGHQIEGLKEEAKTHLNAMLGLPEGISSGSVDIFVDKMLEILALSFKQHIMISHTKVF